MCTYEKIVAFLALCVFASTAIATPIPQEEFKVLTVPEVCDMIATDGKDLAMMYVDGASKEKVASVIAERNDRMPQMAFDIPGIIKMLTILEDVRTEQPQLFLEPDFIKIMGEEVYKACNRDGMNGWIMNIPGKANIIELPPQPEKIRM